jgi:hypothetical protein
MSRTDKTDPWWVRLRFDRSWLVEAHDHRTGECTLPAAPALDWALGHCCWVESSHAWYESGPACCCAMCHGGPRNRQEARRARHQAARDARAALRWANSGLDPLDMP